MGHAVVSTPEGMGIEALQSLHALLAENLLVDAAAGGRLRRADVAIAGSVLHPLPLAIPQRVEECFDLMLARADAINDPFEQAFFIMAAYGD